MSIAAASSSGAQAKHGEFDSCKVKVGQATREYRLVVPRSIELKKPAPLVIAFHGMLIDSKDVMPRYTNLNDTAQKHGFILAYPAALDKMWGISQEKVAADLAFFDAMIDDVRRVYKVASKQIYVLGMSNGGYFAHLVAKERSKTIAAIASHSGPLGLQTLLGVKSDRKFSVMIIHGDKDQIFPIAFARENRDKYQKEGHHVEYLEIADQGHMWAEKAGVNEKIWKFFSEHPLDEKKVPEKKDQH